MRRLFAEILVAAILGVAGMCWAGTIATTEHNLSVTGPGTIKAVSETRICVFCHTPHRSKADTPLWNRDFDKVAATYIPYDSPTLDASPGQPSGASKLCLSCHDGLLALGDVISESQPIQMQGGVTTMPTSSPGYIGEDLSGSHPVSFVFDNALASANNAKGDSPLRMPSTIIDPDVKLDKNSMVQCTSCHDPHNDDNYIPDQVPPFWLKSSYDGVCVVCHDL
jgi:hypothetical protein